MPGSTDSYQDMQYPSGAHTREHRLRSGHAMPKRCPHQGAQAHIRSCNAYKTQRQAAPTPGHTGQVMPRAPTPRGVHIRTRGLTSQAMLCSQHTAECGAHAQISGHAVPTALNTKGYNARGRQLLSQACNAHTTPRQAMPMAGHTGARLRPCSAHSSQDQAGPWQDTVAHISGHAAPRVPSSLGHTAASRIWAGVTGE
ncbi:hypothetical protein NDU88_007383 [Pleurodeles waltl]|uniref:Uncharacterized protein n=1 Tax=Pleurodeles waltl TaxID=8319 RepID=A0AAV7MF12_PLEWA|nr:hypothetical protein NDU88_007383 [Pleurodeles waltl]